MTHYGNLYDDYTPYLDYTTFYILELEFQKKKEPGLNGMIEGFWTLLTRFRVAPTETHERRTCDNRADMVFDISKILNIIFL